MEDIIKLLKEEKNKECETCGCQRYDWCKGYNKALEDLEAEVKKLTIPVVSCCVCETPTPERIHGIIKACTTCKNAIK